MVTGMLYWTVLDSESPGSVLAVLAAALGTRRAPKCDAGSKTGCERTAALLTPGRYKHVCRRLLLLIDDSGQPRQHTCEIRRSLHYETLCETDAQARLALPGVRLHPMEPALLSVP
jgi:hypothetical protein